MPGLPRRGFCRLTPAAGLYRPFRLVKNIPCSGTGYFALGGKVTKTPPGFPRTPICPIGCLQGRYPVATEFLPGRWPLVFGAEIYPLRLTALVLRGFAVFLLSKTHVLPKEAGNSSQKKDSSVPLTGRQPKPDKQPAPDQMPEGFASSVAQHQQSLLASDWATAGIQPEGGWRFFRPLLCVQKWTRRRQNSAEGRFRPLRKYPGFGGRSPR